MDVRRDIAYLLNLAMFDLDKESDRIAREWGLPTAIENYCMTVDERRAFDDYAEGRATDYVLPERFSETGR